MAGYLLDTNHLSAAIRPVSLIRDRILQTIRRGLRLGTCVPVLCELQAGIRNTHDPAWYQRRLSSILRHVRIWPVEFDIAVLYGDLFHELARAGRVVSQVDMMIMAMAKLSNLTILTSDQDFLAIPSIHTENWLL